MVVSSKVTAVRANNLLFSVSLNPKNMTLKKTCGPFCSIANFEMSFREAPLPYHSTPAERPLTGEVLRVFLGRENYSRPGPFCASDFRRIRGTNRSMYFSCVARYIFSFPRSSALPLTITQGRSRE